MKADLHICSEGLPRITLFFKCEYTYINDTAQIVYSDLSSGARVTIGLNRDKISMLIVRGSHDAVDKQFNVLSLVPGTNKEMVELDNMELLFLADDAEVEYNSRIAKAFLRCYISVYGSKPTPLRIKLLCVTRPER